MKIIQALWIAMGCRSRSARAANHHEVRLVQLCFDFTVDQAGEVVGDRAYDSDPLDEELRNDGVR